MPSKRTRDLRLALGLTLEDAAAGLGVSVSGLSRMERQARGISREMAETWRDWAIEEVSIAIEEGFALTLDDVASVDEIMNEGPLARR